jgi:hypothetical protein
VKRGMGFAGGRASTRKAMKTSYFIGAGCVLLSAAAFVQSVSAVPMRDFPESFDNHRPHHLDDFNNGGGPKFGPLPPDQKFADAWWHSWWPLNGLHGVSAYPLKETAAKLAGTIPVVGAGATAIRRVNPRTPGAVTVGDTGSAVTLMSLALAGLAVAAKFQRRVLCRKI